MKKKIAVVAPQAAGLIHDDSMAESYGGAEIQCYYLSKLLSGRYDVKFIVKQIYGSIRSDLKNIKILYTYSNKPTHKRFLRFIYPRLIKDIKALWLARAEIYYQRGPGEITGITSVFCKLLNRRFIYAVSGNGELTDLKVKIKNPVSRLLYKIGVFLSDTILCQSNDQIQLLKKAYRKKAFILRNIYPYDITTFDSYEKKYVLNIGAFRALKRQSIFFELTKDMPDTQFVCIGGGTDQYADKLLEMFKTQPNIYITGHIPHKHVIKYLKTSYCLVNCSNNEGFPNIFLEAWAYGIPVVSLGFDPEGIIKRYSLGLAVQSYKELIDGVRFLISNPETRERFAENGIRYVQRYHSSDVIRDQLFKIMEQEKNV